jgi:hypothetical protein
MFYIKYLGVFLGPQIPCVYAQSNFKEDFISSFGQNIFFCGAFETICLCPQQFFLIFDDLGTLKLINNFDFLPRML